MSLKKSDQSVVSIIPARYASSRFPGKPLAKILGVPLVLRVFQKVTQALPPEAVFVATDDGRIEDVCLSHGVQVIRTSPKCLTGTDRVWEASRQINAKVFINVQGDEPLIHPDDILSVVRTKLENPNHVVNAMCQISDRRDIENPHVPKVIFNEKNEMIYMSRAPIPFVKERGLNSCYYRQVCIYGFTREELKAFASLGNKSKLEALEDIEIIRFLSLDRTVKMVEVPHYSVAVDVPEDISKVEQLLSQEKS